MKITAIILLLMVPASRGFAQSANKGVELVFTPVYKTSNLVLNKTIYTEDKKDSLTFKTFRFYISAIQLYNKNKPVWSEPDSYHLVDAEEQSTMQLGLKVPPTLKYNHLQFNLGIDSATNAQGSGSGDLDATKGMYWAWQSGYINLKLEGAHTLCKTRKNAFEFHLGGFRNEDYCMRQIILPVSSSDTINVEADVSKFINSIDIAKQNTIMTPGQEAVILSQKASKIFSIKTSL